MFIHLSLISLCALAPSLASGLFPSIPTPAAPSNLSEPNPLLTHHTLNGFYPGGSLTPFRTGSRSPSGLHPLPVIHQTCSQRSFASCSPRTASYIADLGASWNVAQANPSPETNHHPAPPDPVLWDYSYWHPAAAQGLLLAGAPPAAARKKDEDGHVGLHVRCLCLAAAWKERVPSRRRAARAGGAECGCSANSDPEYYASLLRIGCVNARPKALCVREGVLNETALEDLLTGREGDGAGAAAGADYVQVRGVNGETEIVVNGTVETGEMMERVGFGGRGKMGGEVVTGGMSAKGAGMGGAVGLALVAGVFLFA